MYLIAQDICAHDKMFLADFWVKALLMVAAVADDLEKRVVAPVSMTSHGFRQSTEGAQHATLHSYCL